MSNYLRPFKVTPRFKLRQQLLPILHSLHIRLRFYLILCCIFFHLVLFFFLILGYFMILVLVKWLLTVDNTDNI